MISKLIKYNLNKKAANIFSWIAMGPPVHIIFLCILSVEDEINLFTIVTV